MWDNATTAVRLVQVGVPRGRKEQSEGEGWRTEQGRSNRANMHRSKSLAPSSSIDQKNQNKKETPRGGTHRIHAILGLCKLLACRGISFLRQVQLLTK